MVLLKKNALQRQAAEGDGNMQFERIYMQPDRDERIIDGVLWEFLGLCDMPHGSGNEQQASDYLMDRLRRMGLSPVRDDSLNVIADLPPTPGCEGAPLTAVQGHMDMVCAAAPHSAFDAARDPVIALVRDGCLCTNGASSLGADCGIGNAAALYLLSHPNTAHGPVRLLFTTGEEVGLKGALHMDKKYVSDVRYLINTDGFQQGDVVVSSSGGRRETYLRPLLTAVPPGDRAWRLSLDGFRGGHSGYDIDKGRANTIKLLSVFLTELSQRVPFALASFDGGTAHNAIPFASEAVLVAPSRHAEAMERAAFTFQQRVSDMFSVTDPCGRVRLSPCALPPRVWSDADMRATLDLCILIYNGVYSMDAYLPGRVGSSSNLGRVTVNGSGQVEVRSMVRCAVGANEEIIAMQHRRAAAMAGFTMTVGGYKGWPGTADNPLAQLMDRVYYRQNARHLHITSMHAGLETSAFYEKNPGMGIVSAGMTVRNPHSPDEHVEIVSIPPYVKMLHGTLRAIGHGLLQPAAPDDGGLLGVGAAD
ncbi:M20/M25/M40 family metallo-hydrolase [Intestinibacillus massiliensis]